MIIGRGQTLGHQERAIYFTNQGGRDEGHEIALLTP